MDGGIKMKIYGREINNIETIIPYTPLEEVHIYGDLDCLDKILNFFLEVKKEGKNISKKEYMFKLHMKDWDKSWKEDGADIVCNYIKK